MADDNRILELVEEALCSELTPEEVCADNPELLAGVRASLDECRRVDLMFESMFPSTPAQRILSPQSQPGAPLPEIPGYQVLGILGRGGHGIVYRVRHLKLKRVAALKMLLTGQYASSAELARFMREAEAIAALHHPNIVQIYDIGEVDGRPYFTMEFVGGGSLAQKLGGVPQPAQYTASVLESLARAIHTAHVAGIIHRDVKPSNVLLTPDGMPKISDFGLARYLEGQADVTLGPVKVGTPSYMAPEQVIGKPGTVGPPADTYALGATLYELLTGRPPFRADSSTETERQLLAQDPVPPSRLNAKIPRDLETICLKCLQKEPARRYESAAALADDLDRFLRLEPITARRVGLMERTAKRVRRRPAVAAAFGVSVLLVVVAGVSVMRFELQRAQVQRAVETDLGEVRDSESAGRWGNADASLRRAEARLDVRSSEDLRRRVNDARHYLDVAMRLDVIRLGRATAGPLQFYQKRADAQYEAAFRESTTAVVGSAKNNAAAKIVASPIRPALVAALDDWATCAAEPRRRRWILELARLSDPDPQGWRDRIRDPESWDDPAKLEEWARAAPVTEPSISLLLAVGERLKQANRDSSSLLRRVQREHPENFWANLYLGDVLLFRSPNEAGVYYRAALAARPEAAVSYSAVADSLRIQRKYQEALDYYNKALTFDPRYARAKCGLGGVLNDLGRYEEAVEACRQSLLLDPNYAWGHFNLAAAFRELGRLESAVDQYAIIYALVPESPELQEAYRGTLIQLGRAEQARVVWHDALESPSRGFDAWTGYPELCLFARNEKEYRRARTAMLDRFASRKEPVIAQQLARSCLLLPAAPGDENELARATALADRALAARSSLANWQVPYYQFVRGLADYRNGNFATAASLVSGEASKVLGPCPKLVLAMALKEQGRGFDALQALAEAAVKFDWRPAKADSRDLWIYHILRREAETKVLPDLQALLEGSRQPRDNNERIAMLAACQFQKSDARCVQVFDDALAAEPKLIEARKPNPGFTAACAACALSQRNSGNARAEVDAQERARRQTQAIRWLNEELAMEMREAQTKDAASREWLGRELNGWRRDPVLASLRDPSALQSLTPEQREEHAAFWKAVDEAITRLQDAPVPATTRPAASSN